MSSPAHSTDPRASLAHALMRSAIERAMFRALHSQGAAGGNAFDKRAMVGVLADAIVRSVHGEDAVDFSPFAWTPEAIPALAGLRRELLCGRTRGSWGENDLLRVVAALENLTLALESDVAVRFAHQFAGAGAQQRLVELAHDMRSPLGAILLLVEQLQQQHGGPVTSAQRRDLALVYGAAFGLSAMANDLMDLARGGAQLLEEVPRVFSVSALLRAVRDVVQPLAEARRVSLRFSGPPADRRIGQPGALNRVLLNLVTNALKFTTVGSVTVTVQQDGAADELTFVVQDTGRGIPESELAEMLSAMAEGSAAGGKEISPDGLGLAICQKLVSAMDGRIAVESRVDEGTRMSFSLRLPQG